jgi:putative tricarboxylic transport membrane protein
MTIKNRDLISSIFCMILGIIFSTGALKYGLGRAGLPGSGFLPFIIGIVLISLSFMLFISAIKKGKSVMIETENFFPEKDSWKKTLLALIALSVYGIILEYLGYLPTTILFMVVILRFVELQRWRMVFIASFLTGILSYMLFDRLLQSQLPRGIFGM